MCSFCSLNTVPRTAGFVSPPRTSSSVASKLGHGYRITCCFVCILVSMNVNVSSFVALSALWSGDQQWQRLRLNIVMSCHESSKGRTAKSWATRTIGKTYIRGVSVSASMYDGGQNQPQKASPDNTSISRHHVPLPTLHRLLLRLHPHGLPQPRFQSIYPQSTPSCLPTPRCTSRDRIHPALRERYGRMSTPPLHGMCVKLRTTWCAYLQVLVLSVS